MSEDEFTLLPEGTMIYEPDDIGRVMIQFPSMDDAIVFHEFLRSFVEGSIKLEVVSA